MKRGKVLEADYFQPISRKQMAAIRAIINTSSSRSEMVVRLSMVANLR